MKYIFCFLIIILLNISCTWQESENPDPPARVQMVLKEAGFDILEYEQGIDAVDGDSNKIQIMWRSHPERSKVTRFNVYRSEYPGGIANYKKLSRSVEVSNPYSQDTVFIDHGLYIEEPYYYYVKAEDKHGQESEPSDTVWYSLTVKAELISPIGKEITETPINFKWQMSVMTPDLYILRIERFYDQYNHPLVYVEVIQSNYQPTQEVSVAGDWLKDSSDNAYYRWRVDCIGPWALNSGSESAWEIFEIDIDWGKK